MAVTTNTNPAATPALNILIPQFLKAMFQPVPAVVVMVLNIKLPRLLVPATNAPATANAVMIRLLPLAYQVPAPFINYAKPAVNPPALMKATANMVLPKSAMAAADIAPSAKRPVIIIALTGLPSLKPQCAKATPTVSLSKKTTSALS